MQELDVESHDVVADGSDVGLRQLDGDGGPVGEDGEGELLQESVFDVEGYDLIDGDLTFG